MSHQLRVERLDAFHNLSDFDSGNDEIDTWLRRHALAAQRMDTSRTFVLTEEDREGLVGFFSLTMRSMEREQAPAKLVRGLPDYPVGMVLLTRLAVDRREQGTGVGGSLLLQAMTRACAAGESVAARLIMVEATDEAAAGFYGHFGFVPAPEHPFNLYRRMKDVSADLGLS